MEIKKNRQQYIIAALILLGAILSFFLVPSFRNVVTESFRVLARGEVELVRDYLLSFGFWAPVVSGLLMVFQSIIAPLPAFVITFANGLLFGVFWGTILSWSSSMIGAAVCFYIARLFGRPVVEKLVGGQSLQFTDNFFKRYGKYAIFLARLIPVISFDVVSYAGGLTSVGFWEFFIATGLGQLPATIVYSYLGHSLTGSIKILFWAFTLVIAFFVIGVILRNYLMTSVAAK